jgi:hypothetical protein
LLVIYFDKLLILFSKAVLQRFQVDVIWNGVDATEEFMIFHGIVPPFPGSNTERVFKVTIPLAELSTLKTDEDLIALTDKYVLKDSQSADTQPIDFNYKDLTDEQLKSLKSTVTILQSQGTLGNKC